MDGESAFCFKRIGRRTKQYSIWHSMLSHNPRASSMVSRQAILYKIALLANLFAKRIISSLKLCTSVIIALKSQEIVEVLWNLENTEMK